MDPDIPALKRLLNDWSLGLQDGGGWNALFWNNHDQPRALNRFGDPGRRRYESATMLATAIHLLRGTPYIYMGGGDRHGPTPCTPASRTTSTSRPATPTTS